MRHVIVTAFGAAALLVGSVMGAQALPTARDIGASSSVEQVAGGCGPGAWRSKRGFCKGMGVYGRPVVVGAPRVVVRRVYRARPYYRRW
jgi:hypothetical protein